MTILAARGLTKQFGGVHAVDGVSVEVAPGTVHAIIGPNGAGKTTLLNLLTGVYRPSAGEVSFDGQEVTGLLPHALAARGMARTFQNLQVFFNMSALENVMVGRYLHERCGWAAAALRLPRIAREERAAREEAAELMRFVGLGDYVSRRPEAMPYGALKRLEVARALAGRPRLVLLDEPAAGLNPTEALALDDLIRRILGRGITVVLVEHNMRLVMAVSDRILVLDYGKPLADGTPAEIRNDARVIAAYLGVEA